MSPAQGVHAGIVARILMLVAFTLLLVFSGELFNIMKLREQRLDAQNTDTVQLARIADLDIGRVLEGARQLLATLAELPVEQRWDERACSVIEATASNDFEYDHIVATDRNGIILCSSSGPAVVGTMTPDRDLFERIVATSKFSVGSYGIGLVSGNEVIRVGYPVTDNAGAVAGAIYAGINVTWLNTALTQWQLGEHAAIIITDRNGVLIASYPNPRGVGQAVTESLKPFLSAAHIGTTELKEAGGNRLYGYIPIDPGASDGLGVFIGRDQTRVATDINRLIWHNVAVALGGLSLSAFLVVIYVHRFLARPFKNLLTAAGRWREGDWSAPAPAASGVAEFDQLAVAFGDMAAAVNQRERASRAAEIKLRASQEALAEAQAIAHVGNWEIDQRTGRVSWSDEVFRIFGVDPQTFVPSYEAILNRTHPDDRAPLGKAYADALATLSKEQSHKVLSIDHRIVLDDGSTRFVHERGRMIFDEKGDPASSIGTVQDITERKIVENALKQERDFSAALIDGLPGLFFVLDSNGKSVRFSPNLSKITGWSDDELAGMDPLRNIVPDDHALARSKMREVIETGQADLEVGVLNHSTGVIYRFFISARRASIDNKPGIIGIGFDVTEARRTEAALGESQQIVRAILDAVPVRIFWKNKDLVYLGCNEIFARDAGFSRPEDIVGKDDYQMGWRDQANLYRADDRRVIECGFNRLLIEEPQTTPEGKVITLLTSKIPLRSSNGQIVGVLGTYMDISDRKQMEEKLVRLARHDILTDLPNRRVFVEELERAIARAHREGESFAVFYLDLDRFKDVNDTLGHPTGDLLLQEVAKRLVAAIRETDTAARFGGDEFALLGAEIREPADAAALADKILKTLAEPFAIQGNAIRSGASVGIAIYGADSPDVETLLSNADVALYRAKAEGRGTYRFFTEAMDTEVQTRVRGTAELREAINSDQLFLLYQPQVNVDTNRIIGLEALVRWHHPTRGIVSPAEFIPIAEKSGLIVELGSWVLHEACRQMKEWLDAGVAPPIIAVNVSGLQFKAPAELEHEISEILAETALPPSLIELELTETVFMEVSREHSDSLQRLRDAGLRLAIDDFGTGYSSLEYLGRIPVNRIKIAQAFMPKLTAKSHNGTIVKASIRMAHELGLDVIIEGVETAEQLELIRSWSGHKVQGFYFSKPLSVSETAAVLRLGKLSPAQRPVAIEAAAE
jgi:diguanylate cyclase (GGDEF)-like protein/PAS domain S-box-containing protein